MNSKQRYMVPLLFIGTVLAGMLSPMQSAVNGQLGKELADGNACAVVSFGSGLVVMFIIILSERLQDNNLLQFLRKFALIIYLGGVG
ncbi:DMT family transporter [Gardnerella vaginalis ATCC 14018 = JCM 11026]|uniref:DMT family transporter n=1 Tax=Gardnerella vaginalis TaxID=2702 RepID=UPI00336A05D9